MPPINRRVPRQRRDYTYWHALHLESGFSWFGEGFGRTPDPVQIAEGWQDLHEVLMQLHLQYHPLSRPWGWWQHTAPERRQRLNGRHPFDDVPASIPEKHQTLFFGLPNYLRSEDHFSATYETQSHYLTRLNLLTKDEVLAVALQGDEGEVRPIDDDQPTLSLEVLRQWWEAL